MAFRSAGFPLLLLFLIVPIPSVVLNRLVAALQVGSTERSYLLFRLAGVFAFRRGMVMSLPGVDIEVAPQCSGVRLWPCLSRVRYSAGYCFGLAGQESWRCCASRP